MIYTVTFNPALDYVVRVTDFCLGATNRCEREELYCGGKGINVSLVLHELGIQNTALGFIAGFTGTALKQKLNAHGITTDFILLPKGFSRINIKLKSGEETEINGRGPQIDPQSLEALYRKLDALRPGDTLVLAGSIPATLPADIYEQILRRLSGRELRFVVDAAGSLLERVLPYRPFLIKPNHHELGELAGTALSPGDGSRLHNVRAGSSGWGRATSLFRWRASVRCLSPKQAKCCVRGPRRASSKTRWAPETRWLQAFWPDTRRKATTGTPCVWELRREGQLPFRMGSQPAPASKRC